MAILSTSASSPEPQKGRIMKKTVSALMLIALLSLMGCNTVQGIGQDIQKGGQAIEGAAKKK
jgi:predicted small secreted protein